MPWKPRRPNQIEKENAALKTTIIVLRSELETRANAVRRLEILARQRSTRIDNLVSRLEMERARCRRLDEENDRLCEMVRLAP
jgi:hypothetical protein